MMAPPKILAFAGSARKRLADVTARLA